MHRVRDVARDELGLEQLRLEARAEKDSKTSTADSAGRRSAGGTDFLYLRPCVEDGAPDWDVITWEDEE